MSAQNTTRFTIHAVAASPNAPVAPVGKPTGQAHDAASTNASCSPAQASADTSARDSALALAQNSARCTHIKVNGARCGSPAVSENEFCYFHRRLFAPAAAGRLTELPSLEDAHGIQLALMQVTNALLQNRIFAKDAALVLYALQIASSNLKRINSDSLDFPRKPNCGL